MRPSLPLLLSCLLLYACSKPCDEYTDNPSIEACGECEAQGWTNFGHIVYRFPHDSLPGQVPDSSDYGKLYHKLATNTMNSPLILRVENFCTGNQVLFLGTTSYWGVRNYANSHIALENTLFQFSFSYDPFGNLASDSNRVFKDGW